MSRPEKKLRAAEEVLADLLILRDHLWVVAGGRPASDPRAELAMQINSILYRGFTPMPIFPGSWNYDLHDIPTKPGEHFLGLWHWASPERDVVHIIWAAEHAHPVGIDPKSGIPRFLRYLCHAGSDLPHYIQPPHAWAPIPKVERPGHGK